MHDFIETAAIRGLKLRRVFVVLFFNFDGVAPDRRAGTAGNLRNAEFQRFVADAGTFSCAHDHAGVGNGEANERHDLQEKIIRDGVRKGGGINIVCRADARHADRVRAYAEDGFQMFGVHQKSHEVVAAEIEAEKNAEAHVVDTAFHRTVVRFRLTAVVRFRSLRMQFFVGLLVIRFLKKLIGADLSFVQLAVVFHGRRRNVDVDAADGTVLMFDAVDGVDRLEDVFDRIVFGVLARFEQKTFMPHVLQRDHFTTNFVLRELLADDVFVFCVVRAVDATIHAVIGEVEGRKEHDTLAVDVLLYLDRSVKNCLVAVREITRQEDGGFAVSEAFALRSLMNQCFNERTVGLMFFCISERGFNLVVVDEVLGGLRFRVVHG